MMHTTYPNPFVAFCADAGFDSANHARCNEGWRYVSALSIHDPATAIQSPDLHAQSSFSVFLFIPTLSYPAALWM